MPDVREQLQASLGSAFAIERELGGGGMSRVFLARDTTLERPIVIKLLPEDAAATLSAERFKREIAVAAKLQHPHIVPLLSAGEVQGLPFYTMPFVEGESLRDRLAREGELAIDETLQILKEVARALAYAHDHGIVHRDIKPDNVMLSGGASMVTDFGVAKAVSASAAPAGHTSLTQLGVALGTPAYMAPEQARADATIDHRADLYSLGCLGYELLTGQPPFAGRGAQATLAAQVTEQPEPVEKRRPSVPPALAAIVMQCLEKRAADRPKNAGEVLRALDAVVVTPHKTSAYMATSAEVHGIGSSSWLRDPRTIALIVVTVLAVALGARAITDRAVAGSADGSVFSSISFIDGTQVAYDRGFALSPDEKRLVFVGRPEDSATVTLWIRRLTSPVATPLAGTSNAMQPFWSPDGRHVGYFANGWLRVRSVNGSEDRALCRVDTPEGGSWGSKGVIVYAPQTRGPMWAVNAAGGECSRVTTLTAGVLDHRRPSFLPDGRHYVFGSGSAATIFVGDIDTKQHAVLLSGVAYGAFVDPGFLFFGKGGLFAQRLDPDRLRLEGDAVPLLDNLGFTPSARPLFTARRSTLIAMTARASSRSLVRMTRDGAVTGTHIFSERLGAVQSIEPSHDRSRVAVGGRGLWIYDVERDATSMLIAGSDTGAVAITGPHWAPGDTAIFYTPTAGADMGIRAYSFRTGQERIVVSSRSNAAFMEDLSPDGRWVLYNTTDPSGIKRNISLLDLVSGKSEPIFGTRPALDAQFSPDGRWVAFTSNESGRNEIYVMSLRARMPIRVTREGGSQPVWRGGELYYRGPSRVLMVIPIELAEHPRFGASRVALLDPSYEDLRVSSDARVLYGLQFEMRRAMALIQNWPARLESR